jgi:hypothetical protein
MAALTSQIQEVVVLETVDGFELAADIVLLSCVEQVPDGRVLVVSAKDLLGLEGSVMWPSCQSCCAMRVDHASAWHWVGSCSLIRLVDVLDREDGQIAVVAEIAQGHACASLDAQLLNVLVGEIECDGNAEEGAACEAVFLNDSGVCISRGCLGARSMSPSFRGWHCIPIVVGLGHESYESNQVSVLILLIPSWGRGS